MNDIKCLILDVDGTLTDGNIHISANGELFKSFNIKDGYAIRNILPRYQIIPVVLTARRSEIVEIRCGELDISHCYQGVDNKLEFAASFLADKLEIKFDNVAYMGDDVIDLPCMEQCALKGCPRDAVDEVKAICDFVSEKDGGRGAAREFIEWLVNRNRYLGAE